MVRMRASTCDVASRTSFDSSGYEDGREPVLRDEAEGAAHRAAHWGNSGMGCLMNRGGVDVELDLLYVITHNTATASRACFWL